MTELERHVQDYLVLRRGMGFVLRSEAYELPQLAAYLDAAGGVLTAELAISWAALRAVVKPISLAHRLGAAHGFARYLKTIDPRTEFPPTGIWPATVPRPAPYLHSDAEITARLAAARGLEPPLRAATLQTVLGWVCWWFASEAAGGSAGWALLDEHPFLQSYLTPGHPCGNSGRTGTWNVMTGSSGGWQDTVFDLSVCRAAARSRCPSVTSPTLDRRGRRVRQRHAGGHRQCDPGVRRLRVGPRSVVDARSAREQPARWW